MFAFHKTARIGREDIFLPNFPIICRDFVEVCFPPDVPSVFMDIRQDPPAPWKEIGKGSSF